MEGKIAYGVGLIQFLWPSFEVIGKFFHCAAVPVDVIEIAVCIEKLKHSPDT